MKSSRDHLLDKYNLSMINKSAKQINELKSVNCDGSQASTCYNPFVRTTNSYGRKLGLCMTPELNHQRLKNQYIKSSSQYTNHNIVHGNKQAPESKKYCDLCLEDSSPVQTTQQLTYLPIIAPRAIESNMLLENVSKGVSNESYRKAHILSGKITLAFSTLESTTRVFENNTTKEYLAFETPENTMISKIMLKSYNDLKTINPVTKMILKNSENNVLLNTEFGVENLRQNIISEKIKGPKNKTNTHSYTLEVTDPNTIDEATLIMSKRNYVLEVHYNGY